jgi:hypothetical protein
MYGPYEATHYPGRLTGKADARDAVLDRLHPFDIILVANKSYPFGNLIPGRFSHVYLYTGSEAEMRAAGLWDLPEVVPHRAEIRAGKRFLEAVTPAARLITPSKGLEVDAAAILHRALTPSERRYAARAAFSSLGLPYDFFFNVDTPQTLSCTELVNKAYPELHLKIRPAYGQHVILPDDVVAQAIRGEGMHVAGYIVGTTSGWEWRGVGSLMADISAYWGLPRATLATQ